VWPLADLGRSFWHTQWIYRPVRLSPPSYHQELCCSRKQVVWQWWVEAIWRLQVHPKQSWYFLLESPDLTIRILSPKLTVLSLLICILTFSLHRPRYPPKSTLFTHFPSRRSGPSSLHPQHESHPRPQNTSLSAL
jgi:hypothetical protein